jgi:Holliday junction resolvase
MSFKKKCSNEVLINEYSITKSIYKTADKFGMCPQSVHERLVKLGIDTKMNTFSDADKEILRTEYEKYASTGNLAELAKKLGRTKYFIARQARQLGLTNQKRPKSYASTWKYISEEDALKIFESFRESSLTLGRYCKKMGFDDLGFSKTMKKYFPGDYESIIEAKAPLTSMYRRGRAFEYRIRDDLRKKKYFVLRSPASKSPLDLIAISNGIVLFVQCKLGGDLCVSEWNALFDLAVSVGAFPILAIPGTDRKYRYYRLDAKKDGSKKRQPMTLLTFEKTSFGIFIPKELPHIPNDRSGEAHA